VKIADHLEVPDEAIEAFCRKWKITQIEVFGSALREDFGPESDVDLLVRFERPIPWGLFDIVRMEDELTALFGRRVDLVDRLAVEESPNYIRRRAILGSARTVYAA
jgi:hypothetical protein